MATYTQNDITNPNQKMALAGANSSYGYIFRDSNVTPEVGETISVWGQIRTIKRIERQNKPGEYGAVVRAV